MMITIVFDDYIELCVAKTLVSNIRHLDPLDWLEYGVNIIGISDKIYKILKQNRVRFMVREADYMKNFLSSKIQEKRKK